MKYSLPKPTALICYMILFFNGMQSFSQQEYRISIDQKDPMMIRVTAQVNILGDTLYMNSNCPNYDYPEGWSSFISELNVFSSDGKSISYQYVSKSKWVLEKKGESEVTIQYSVDLRFITEKWDVGNEQAGFTDGDAYYVVTKALFIYGDVDTQYSVSFDISKKWDLATAWTESTGKRSFVIPNQESLVENSLVYGKYYHEELQKGVFRYTIALLGDAEADAELFRTTIRGLTDEYVGVFDETPPTSYLITMFYNDVDDGESFLTSFCFTLRDRMEEYNKIIWANQMAHELFHYWNSDLIRAENYTEKQWFSEGTAEYYANLALIRTGIISEEVFLSKVEKVLGHYQNYRGWREGETSLVEAGQKKGLHRFLVYNGGWAVAMALDVLIMENSKGEKTLDDFMQKMFEKYQQTPYSYLDLVETASEIHGSDLSWFFDKYVGGTELIPLADYLEKLGYRYSGIVYEGEIYLSKKAGEPSWMNQLWLRQQ